MYHKELQKSIVVVLINIIFRKLFAYRAHVDIYYRTFFGLNFLHLFMCQRQKLWREGDHCMWMFTFY